MRVTHSERTAVETEEQREVRLQRMRITHSERTAVETEEQREVRLQRMRITRSERMDATHQCFLTKRSLYLLVWDIQDGEAGVRSLKTWLENIEGCAPKSPVIIVGIHLDTVPQSRREERERQLRSLIQELYVDYSHGVYCYPSCLLSTRSSSEGSELAKLSVTSRISINFFIVDFSLLFTGIYIYIYIAILP